MLSDDLNPEASPQDGQHPSTERKPVIRALVLTDLVGSTRLVETLGDSRAVEVSIRHDRTARDLVARFHGLEIDKSDGFLLLFERPTDAVGYALAYHQALAGLSREEGVELQARIGIHLGEVFLRRNTAQDVTRGAKPLEVEGLAKPMAARVTSLAGGRQTLLTRGVFDLARRSVVGGELTDPEPSWLAHGTYLLDGVDEPVEIFEVGVEGFSALCEPADTAKARRVLAHGDELTLGWRPAAGRPIPGRRHWVLAERAGEGGFGEVWLARHKSGEERIFKFCFEAARLRALKREVTLFRLLKEALGHRQDITRILDWNFEEAPYFLEAEYTESGNLADWAADQGGLAEVPISTRLELVAQVADALAAAHSVGVLHKDVKPENVLISSDVEGRPRAQLTDFGIGLVTDRELLAAQGLTVAGFTETLGSAGTSSSGSLRYMAPELLEGKPASVQADLYSLGVLLYQTVVGDFSRALAPGWRRQVADELLVEDIARIVDGSPERRPGSALEIAERLRTLEERRRQLDDERRQRQEAEQARRDLERAQRRRKLSAAVAAVAVVVLAVVSLLALEARRARAEADNRRLLAENLIDFMLDDLQGKLEAVGRLDILNDVGQEAQRYFSAIPESQLSDGDLARRARALQQLGQVRLQEADFEAATQAFRESQALLEARSLRDPTRPEWLKAHAESYFWLGRAAWDQGDRRQALEQWQQQLGVTRDLLKIEPDAPDSQLQLAYALSNVGFAQEARGELSEALAAYRETLEIKQRIADLAPENGDRQLDLSYQNNLVGWLLFQIGDLRGARRHLDADHEIIRTMLARDPQNTLWQRKLVISHNYLGRLLFALEQFPSARSHHEQALKVARELVAIDPAQTDWRRELAVTHRRMSLVLNALQEPREALSHAQQGEAILDELVAASPEQMGWQRDLAMIHLQAGQALLQLSRFTASRDRAEEAIKFLKTLVENDPDDRLSRKELGASYLLLARALEGSGVPEAANAEARKAAEMIEPMIADSRDVELLVTWAAILALHQRNEEAMSVREEVRALRADRKTPGNLPPNNQGKEMSWPDRRSSF